MLAVEGGEADAEVVGQAAEEDASEVALAEVSGEAGGGGVVVFEEGGVGVDVGAEAFAEDELGLGQMERGVEVGSLAVLDAVVGPEGLRAVVGFDRSRRDVCRDGRWRRRCVRGGCQSWVRTTWANFVARAIVDGR